MIVFLDTSALIYLLESEEPFRRRARDRLSRLTEQAPALQLALSRLTWLEARVGPMKQKQAGLLQAYDGFFARPDLIWVELNRDVVELARRFESATDSVHPTPCRPPVACSSARHTVS